MRQIVLDMETTGISAEKGHRIIEIGCVELINRKVTGEHYHVYINPEREVDAGAMRVHGITNEFLEDKQKFTEIHKEFKEFVEGAQLIIHNAKFDLSFLDAEFSRLNAKAPFFSSAFQVIDTLEMARNIYPGQRNSLDALCKRLKVDNSTRSLHGALLDAQILAEVYLKLTYGQTKMDFGGEDKPLQEKTTNTKQLSNRKFDGEGLKVVFANNDEIIAHKAKLAKIVEQAGQDFWAEQE